MRIAVFGLGKLGSVIAALHAVSGNQVVGVDPSPSVLDALGKSRSPFLEPQLQELISQAGANLTTTSKPSEALIGSNVSIVIVPTPSLEDGAFTNEYIIQAVQETGSAIIGSEPRHTVIIASTVMPGSCMGDISNALEQASGKKVGQDVGLVYNPQFIALGSIVSNMRKPDLILIGESDERSGEIALDLALAIAENEPAVSRIGLTSAELAKIAINTFVTTKISFANMLGEFCSALGDADVDDVTAAVGSDSRIGRKYLQGALGYGGPCFPRDNIALAAAAERLGVDASIAVATDKVNNRQVHRISKLVSQVIPKGGSVTLFGLAYKPETPVCDQSQAIDIANSLFEQGINVFAYDELVGANDILNLASGITLRSEPNEDIYCSDVAVFTHPVSTFKGLDFTRFRCTTVVDIWGSVDESDF